MTDLIDKFAGALAQAHRDLEHGTVTAQDAIALKQSARVGSTRDERASMLVGIRHPGLIGLVLASVLHERMQSTSREAA